MALTPRAYRLIKPLRNQPHPAGGSPAPRGATLTRVRSLLVAALVTLLAAPAGASGALPGDLSPDPLDRAALLAVPSVYRLEVTTELDALRTRDGTVVPLPAEARRLVERGTAFAVAPGWVLSARHVAARTPAEVAADAYFTKLLVEGREHSDAAARAWVSDAGAGPVGARVTDISLRPERPSESSPARRVLHASVTTLGDCRDLALLRVDDSARAPALVLADGHSIGTPVVVLGYGSEGVSDPPGGGVPPLVARRGEVRRTGFARTCPRQTLVTVTADIQRGDSGGPVVDATGRVLGLVSLKSRTGAGGSFVPTSELRRLLRRAGVPNEPGPAAVAFAAGMRALWSLDLPAARRGLERARAVFPAHPLARDELARVDRLEAAEFQLTSDASRRGTFAAIAVVSAVAAAACAAGLALRR
jgi:hypothetical protein